MDVAEVPSLPAGRLATPLGDELHLQTQGALQKGQFVNKLVIHPQYRFHEAGRGSEPASEWSLKRNVQLDGQFGEGCARANTRATPLTVR